MIEAAGRCRLGEGPVWSARQNAVYWVDILEQRVLRMALIDETIKSWLIPEKIGWLIERQHEPGFIAGLQSGFAVLSLEPFAVQPIADPEVHLPRNRMNDAKADAAGRIWAGTMDVDADKPSGSCYRLDADRTFTLVDTGYLITNGPAFSPDQRTLYQTDSGRGVVYQFDLTSEGTLVNRRIFLEFDATEGAPDGMTVDAEGFLWIALWGASRVSRFSADGHFDRSIALPASQISSCTFAGAQLERMFVTSAAEGVDEPFAGALFEVDPGVRGLEPGRFAG